MAELCTGGEVLADLIVRQGVRTVFALAGASHTHLLAALAAREVAIVPSRHEAATVLAADGYARVTGRPGIALVIADQGLPNAVAGLATAHAAHSPVIVLVARLAVAGDETDADVDQDRHGYVAPVSKWARTVHDPDRLAEYFATAWRHATHGRPGPAVLSFDHSFLGTQVRRTPVAKFAPPPIAMPDPSAIEAAANLLEAAQRPLVVAGAQATRDGAGPALARFARDFGVPVLGNGLGRGLVDEDGAAGFSWPYAQYAAHAADAVVLAGARPSRRIGFALPPRIAASASLVQIAATPEALHRNRPMDVAIAADVASSLASLADALATRGWRRSTDWLVEALAPRAARVRDVIAAHSNPAAPVHPLALARALDERIPANAIVVGDGADIQNWMYGALRARPAPGFLEHYPLGAMGVGTPLAVGAAAAARELANAGAPLRKVVLVTGDGSFGFYPFELQSAAQAGLPITIVVGNDGAWGTELHGQQRAVGRAYNTALEPSSYEHVAAAFDCRGHRVARLADLAPALDAALVDPRPSLVNVLIDPLAGAQLKSDPLLNMILFNDLADGHARLEAAVPHDGDARP